MEWFEARCEAPAAASRSLTRDGSRRSQNVPPSRSSTPLKPRPPALFILHAPTYLPAHVSTYPIPPPSLPPYTVKKMRSKNKEVLLLAHLKTFKPVFYGESFYPSPLQVDLTRMRGGCGSACSPPSHSHPPHTTSATTSATASWVADWVREEGRAGGGRGECGK